MIGDTAMNKKEMILSVLEKMGYTPEIDSDGDILFCYQIKAVYVLMGDENDTFVTILLPQFHGVEDGEEAYALAACNKMNREMKMTKVYVDQNFKSVSASCEFYYTNEESLEKNLHHSLQVLGVVRSLFKDNLEELND